MKQRLAAFAYLLIILLLATGCDALEDSYGGKLILDGQHVLPSGQVLDGMLIVGGGSMNVERDARVTGPIYVVGGALGFSGVAEGDLSILDGALALGPEASVAGDLLIGGGTIDRASGAEVVGETIRSAVELPERPERATRSAGAFVVQFILTGIPLALVAFLVKRSLPHPLRRIRRAARRNGLVSGAVGVLALIVGPALLVQMAFTVVLIPVALLGLLAGFLVIGYGLVALGDGVGAWLAARFRRSWSPGLQAAVGTLLLLLLMDLIALIPFVGALVAIGVMAVALGAVMLTRFGRQIFVPATYPEDDRAGAQSDETDWEVERV